MEWVPPILIKSPWLGASVFVVAAVCSAYLCYAIARRVCGSRTDNKSEFLARNSIALFGTLNALILSLMFVQEMSDYRDVARVASFEAGAIADVYFGLAEYGRGNPETAITIRHRVVAYVRSELEDDRAALAEGHLSSRTWAEYKAIERQLRGLEPGDDYEADLRTQILADWDAVSNFRQQLEASVKYQVPNIFWWVAILGFLAVVVPWFVYAPVAANLTMLGTFSAFDGLVLYAILAVSNPFNGAGSIGFGPLESLLVLMGT